MELTEAKLNIFQSVKLDDGVTLVRTANACLENPVFLVDCGFHPLFREKDRRLPEYELWLERARAALGQTGAVSTAIHGKHGEEWMIQPILVKSILVGYAAVCNLLRPFQIHDRELLACIAEAAATQCSLFSQMIQISDLSPHSHRMLFDDLLDMQIPHPGELQQRLDEIKWTAYHGLYVVSVALRDVPYSAQFPMLQSSISQQINQIVPVYTYTYHFNQLVLLLCFGDVPEPAMTADQTVALEQLLRNMNLRAGISQRLSELTDANEGFAQAQMAVEMPQKLDLENNFHTYDSVALYHMIQSSKSKIRDYHTFMHRAIAILKKFDAENHQELLNTLYVYLRESQKAIKAAEILCIHKNTLFYRLRKIREITGIDLDRSDEVLHLQISFLILRYEGEMMA